MTARYNQSELRTVVCLTVVMSVALALVATSLVLVVTDTSLWLAGAAWLAAVAAGLPTVRAALRLHRRVQTRWEREDG